jgi:hypothetical protein
MTDGGDHTSGQPTLEKARLLPADNDLYRDRENYKFLWNLTGDLDKAIKRRGPNSKRLPLPLKVHLENLAVFLPRVTRRRHQVSWSRVARRSLVALVLLECIARGDPDFGDRDQAFFNLVSTLESNKSWVFKNLFGTDKRSGRVWMLVDASNESRVRRVRRPRTLPWAIDYASGVLPGSPLARKTFWNRYLGFSKKRVLGCGYANPEWMATGPVGKHWRGVYPDLWDRVPTPGEDLPWDKRSLDRRRRYIDPSWGYPGGGVEMRDGLVRKFTKRTRDVLINDLGLGREIDWARWMYNGWHTFPGAIEAVQSCADQRVRERLGSHPGVTCLGGPGSPLLDPRGRPGEAGNWLDVVETEAPWVYVRFTRKFKRELFNNFENLKGEWKVMENPIAGLTKPVQKIVEPHLEEARNMTQREKHTHLLGLGDGVSAFCKHLGELRMSIEEAYTLAFPEKSQVSSTRKGAASRLLKDPRVALGIAICGLQRQDICATAAEVKFSELYSRAMEVFQASMDVANHKEAMTALKFIAEISGHTGKGKGGAGVSVNILNQQQGTGQGNQPNGSLNSGGGFGGGSLLIEDNSNTNLLPVQMTREQRARARISELTNILDTRGREMEYVNTHSLSLEDDESEDDV